MSSRKYKPLDDDALDRLRKGAGRYSSWVSYAWARECMHCDMPGWSVIAVAKPDGTLGVITLCGDHALQVKDVLREVVGPAKRIQNESLSGEPTRDQFEGTPVDAFGGKAGR